MGSKRSVGTLVLLVALAVLSAGCGGSGKGTQAAQTSLGDRPSTPATIQIVEPRPGTEVTGGTLHVKLAVQGAKILNDPRTIAPKPDEGHVHINLDGSTVSMSYGTDQDIKVTPGTHLLEAEFVAGDHLPFEPRVAQKTTFTAK